MSDENVIEEVVLPEAEQAENRAEARIKELLEAKSAAEAATAAESQARVVAEARYEEAMRHRMQVAPDPEPESDEWVDPAERQAKAALKAAEEAKRIATDSADTNRRQMAAMSIDRALASHDDWLNVTGTKNRLAERFFLAQAQGNTFDAAAEVLALHKEEQDALAGRQEAWAKTKANQATATASVTHSPSPPTAPRTEDRPRWGTPERAAYDNNIEREILAEYS